MSVSAWLPETRTERSSISTSPAASIPIEAKRNGARLPVAALVDQFYAQVQARGGRRWDTSSLMHLLAND